MVYFILSSQKYLQWKNFNLVEKFSNVAEEVEENSWEFPLSKVNQPTFIEAIEGWFSFVNECLFVCLFVCFV
jgi:hypothetical protein